MSSEVRKMHREREKSETFGRRSRSRDEEFYFAPCTCAASRADDFHAAGVTREGPTTAVYDVYIDKVHSLFGGLKPANVSMPAQISGGCSRSSDMHLGDVSIAPERVYRLY